MNGPHRPSILHRPLRAEGGLANHENLDREYAKEQSRIAAKAARQASHEERLVAAYYGTQDEKRRGWEAAQAEAASLAAAKAAAQAAAHHKEAEWLAQPQRVYVDSQRPYVASNSTYYMPVEMEVEARRRAQREAAELNRRMQQLRLLEGQRAAVTEQAVARSTMQAEDNWFNRGAASERWVPPERRVHRRAGSPPPHLAPAPPPYYCDAAEGTPSSSRAGSLASTPASASAPHCGKGGSGSFTAGQTRPSSRGVYGATSATARVFGWEEAPGAAARPSTAPAAADGTRRTQAPNPARLREGEGAKAALQHDGAELARPAPQPAQRPTQMSHPWSWDT